MVTGPVTPLFDMSQLFKKEFAPLGANSFLTLFGGFCCTGKQIES